MLAIEERFSGLVWNLVKEVAGVKSEIEDGIEKLPEDRRESTEILILESFKGWIQKF